MGWTVPQYSRGAVDKAGRIFSNPTTRIEEREEARIIVDNWRSSHTYPLNALQIKLRRDAKKISSNAVVAQRLKRMPSLINKLLRFEKTNLSRMQDIAGCRAIMPDLPGVEKLVRKYTSRGFPYELCTERDYIFDPKPDGYRGVHLVCKYKNKRRKAYDGLRIEIQVRTTFQHSWATAVETIDLLTNQRLKADAGDKVWARFFALMGTAIANREGCPPIPRTPWSSTELKRELWELEKRIRARDKLMAYGEALKVITGPDLPEAYYYLLELNTSLSTIYITPYLEDQSTIAYEAYARSEAKPHVDAVLVVADSIATLKSAYPNYYADTAMFVDLINQALA